MPSFTPALSPAVAKGGAFIDTTASQNGDGPTIREIPFEGSVPLFTGDAATPVVVDTSDAEVVNIAAASFVDDVKRLSGTAPEVHSGMPSSTDEVIIAGSVEQSDFIQRFLEQNAFDASHIDSGQWESFVMTVVENPFEGADRALVVAGSDPRGTAFGLFELSKRMGISPWVWWADATVDEADALHISDGLYEFGPPSVKYRGIFLNDERWGLRPWAANTLEPKVGNIGKTYARIYELLLRLKANHIWPAMHEGTLPFYEHPENQETADDYAITIGTSHTEVMLYNNAEEWDTERDGPWDYTQNANGMRENWIVNVGDLKRREWGMEYFLQMGWDINRWEPNSTRDYFEQVAARDISPRHAEQIGALMAEYYDLAVQRKPELMGFSFHWFGQDDVTDPKFSPWNYGDEVQQRIEQYRDLRHRAERLYKKLGEDAKAPFFQLVYYPIRGATSMNEKLLHAYKSREYAAQGRAETNVHAARAEAAFDRILDDIHAYNKEIEDGKWDGIVEYKPGLGGGAKVHTPPDTRRVDLPLQGSLDVAVEGSQQLLGDLEASGPVPPHQIEVSAQDARLRGPALARGTDAKGAYVARAEPASDADPDSLQGAAFDFTLEEGDGGRYALFAVMEHHDETLWTWESPPWTVTLDQRSDTTTWNEDVGEGRFKVTEYTLESGDHTVRFRPEQAGAKLRGIELVRLGTNVLPQFNRQTRRDYFIDVVNTGQMPRSWTAEPSASWIDLSTQSGTVDDESHRIQVSIDYAAAPQRADLMGHVDVSGEAHSFRVYVPVSNEPRDVPAAAHVEDNGVVAIHAEHPQATRSGAVADWTRIDGLSHTGAAMALDPITDWYVEDRRAVSEKSPALEYEVVVSEGGPGRLTIDAVPSFPVLHGKSLRTAVSVDGGKPQWVIFQMGPAESRNWKYNVAQNSMSGSIEVTLEPGRHTLTLWGTDPSINVDTMTLDFGGLRHSYLGPPETIVRSR